MTGQIHILGPQSPNPNLAHIVKSIVDDGPIAVINAGWRHDEDDLSALARDLERQLLHLPLYRWFDELGQREPELSGLHRERQKAIKAYKKVYRIQLNAAFQIWDKIRSLTKAHPEQYDQDEEDACTSVRMADRRALERIAQIRDRFPLILEPWEHSATSPHQDAIERKLSQAKALILTGGHVAILRNRLHFFGLNQSILKFHQAGKPIIAWSAGAMALTEQIVLYYDDPPQGLGIPEVLDTGIGLIKETIFLPHASTRLRLENKKRLSRLARRFAPNHCICLENGDHFIFENNQMLRNDLISPKPRAIARNGTLFTVGGPT